MVVLPRGGRRNPHPDGAVGRDSRSANPSGLLVGGRVMMICAEKSMTMRSELREKNDSVPWLLSGMAIQSLVSKMIPCPHFQ